MWSARKENKRKTERDEIEHIQKKTRKQSVEIRDRKNKRKGCYEF